MTDSVGGPIYIGDAPGGETLPENDSTIDLNQIVKNNIEIIYIINPWKKNVFDSLINDECRF